MGTSVKVASIKSDSTEPANKTPYMSEYDRNIEPRIKALEDQAHASCKTGRSTGIDEDKITALETKVDDLIKRLSAKMSF